MTLQLLVVLGSASTLQKQRGLPSELLQACWRLHLLFVQARKDGFKEGKRRGKKKYKSWGVVRLQQARRHALPTC